MDTKIIEQLEEVFGNEFDLSEQDLGSLEDTVNEKVRLWVKGLLQSLGQRSKNVLCRKHQAKAHNDIKWPKSSILTDERLKKINYHHFLRIFPLTKRPLIWYK